MNKLSLKIFILLTMLTGLVTIETQARQHADSLLSTLKKEHPRLIATAADFERIVSAKETDAYVKEAFLKIYSSGETIIGEPVSEFVIPDGKRLLATSRRVVNRISTLGFLYRVSKEKRFADRAWAELFAASRFPNWNPTHFLDVGEMTYAFALGYDWLFDYWTSDQKRIIKSAMMEKGLSRALLAYEGLASQEESWWTDVPHNWNQVCNGGIGVGALAIADEEPALANRILKHVVSKLPLAMKHFAPDGAWNEGPGYWSYATMYNVAILASLKSALGTDFGLSATEGFSKTGLFPVYNNSPVNKSFNYADGGDERIAAAQLFWFAREFKQPAMAQYLFAFKPADPFAVLWYDEKLVHASKELPPDVYFRESEVVTMRSKWNDSLATFVAFKAGDNKANHSHLDLGSFILDAIGERWIFDLGADNYNIPGYFSSGAKGQRWTYYRTRAEGNNTLVVNPGKEPDQDPKASTRVVSFKTNDGAAFGIMDLSAAYAPQAKSLKRGIALAEKRKLVIVQDEIHNTNASDIYWFAHTKAEISLSKDGRTATLSQHGKKYQATLVYPTQARFTIMPATPLPTSPQPKENNLNTGVQKLTVQLQGTTEERIVVVFHPVNKSSKTAFSNPLNSWK